jgi:hypothetical protein
MASIPASEDWLTLIDERNEPALRAALVAAWAAAFLSKAKA